MTKSDFFILRCVALLYKGINKFVMMLLFGGVLWAFYALLRIFLNFFIKKFADNNFLPTFALAKRFGV